MRVRDEDHVGTQPSSAACSCWGSLRKRKPSRRLLPMRRQSWHGCRYHAYRLSAVADGQGVALELDAYGGQLIDVQGAGFE